MKETQLETHAGSPASSCMAFARSMGAKYRELLKTGDMADRRPRRETGAANELYSEILQRCHAGESPRDVCQDVGVRLETFYAYCAHRRKSGDKGWGLKRKKLGRKSTISAPTIKKAEKLRKQGLTWNKIAENLGVKAATIRKAVINTNQ